jgi:hypothetical protein
MSTSPDCARNWAAMPRAFSPVKDLATFLSEELKVKSEK